MSDYVDIKTSIADLLTAASGLSTLGSSLTERLKPLLADVAARDTPALFPSDSFSDPFTESYWEPIKAGDDSTLPKNEAVRTSAAGVGEAMQGLADYVTQVMWMYKAADDDSASGIAGAGGG